LQLRSLPDDSLARTLRDQGWVVFARSRPHPVLELPSAWEDYLKMLSANQRSVINRRLRKLERACLRRCEGEVQHWLDLLFDLHARRWQLRGQPGAFAFPGRQELFRKVADRFLLRGWLDFWMLEIDGCPASLEFGFSFEGTYCFLQSAFEPKFEEQGAGVALKALVIQQLITRGIKRYDFLSGDEAYKSRWGTRNLDYVDVTCAPGLSLGAAYVALRGAAHKSGRWLRQVLPAGA
ncbi:MAG: GNAT family N-acetyltransferase, partial [Burkholderiales bacterium]